MHLQNVSHSIQQFLHIIWQRSAQRRTFLCEMHHGKSCTACSLSLFSEVIVPPFPSHLLKSLFHARFAFWYHCMDPYDMLYDMYACGQSLIESQCLCLEPLKTAMEQHTERVCAADILISLWMHQVSMHGREEASHACYPGCITHEGKAAAEAGEEPKFLPVLHVCA